MLKIRTFRDFHRKARPLIDRFDAFAKKLDLVDEIAADHISYKCGSSENFALIRALLEAKDVCEFSYLSFISDRRIVYIRIREPLATVLGPIYFVELADQKPDNSQVDGFDHIEAYPRSIGLYGEFEVRLHRKTQGKRNNRAHHPTFDVPLPGGGEFRFEKAPLVWTIREREMR